MTDTKSIEKMSLEEALAELEEIVKKIDTGQENLSDAVSSFERGVELKKRCDQMLTEAKLKIEKISKTEEGNIAISEVEIQ